MWDIWTDIDRMTKAFYPPVTRLPVSHIVRNESVERIDNGFILTFSYSDAQQQVSTRAKRFFSTEAELEQGIAELKHQFAEELKKHGQG